MGEEVGKELAILRLAFVRDCPPTIKFPLDPSSEEGREETESAGLVSGAQAKRSDRMGHDASG